MKRPSLRRMLATATSAIDGRLRSLRKRRVLLVTSSPLMTSSLLRLWNVLGSEPDIAFWCMAFGHEDPARVTRPLVRVGVRRLGLTAARCLSWDLIVFAHHIGAQRRPFPKEAPRLYMRHGSGGGKSRDGSDHAYAPPLVFWPDGRPIYRMIFEPSKAERDRVVARCPALAGIIEVVGDLRHDELLSRARDRAAIRARLGLAPTDRAVVLVSTWDEDCLLERMGPALVEQLKTLGSPWRVLLALHPHQRAGGRGRNWEAYAARQAGEGVLLPPSEADNADLLVASDVGIFDHTSVATAYALLGRPLVFLELPVERIVPGSNFDRLYELSPHLTDPSMASPVLEQALTAYPLDQLRALATRINSYPGEAASRVRAAVRQLLF